MPRPIRTPYNPAKPVHSRLSTDLTRLAEVAPIEVDDPMGLDPGDKIVVMRSIRNDPLARLHACRHINEAQYQAGREFQNDFEIAGRSLQGADPTREAVDGGQIAEPITEAQQKAVKRLARVQPILGQDGSALIHAVLIQSMTFKQIALSRSLNGRKWEEYFGTRFKECLTALAVCYGFAMRERT